MALAEIGKDRGCWTTAQKDAYKFFNRFFANDKLFRALEEALKHSENAEVGSLLIEKFGALFLCDGLKGMDFEYVIRTASIPTDDRLAETAPTSNNDGNEKVRFFAAHPSYQRQDVRTRRDTFFGVLFHEAIHAFFMRDQTPAMPFLSANGSRHHPWWCSVAEAVERRATQLWNGSFNLNLAGSRALEEKMTGFFGTTATAG